MESKRQWKSGGPRAPQSWDRYLKWYEFAFPAGPVTKKGRQNLKPFLKWAQERKPNDAELSHIFNGARLYAFARNLQAQHPKRRPKASGIAAEPMGEQEKARRQHLRQIQRCAQRLVDLIDEAQSDLGIWVLVARAFEGERFLIPATVAEALTLQLRTLVKDAERVLRENPTQRDVMRRMRAEALQEMVEPSQAEGGSVPWAALASLLEVFGVITSGSELQTEAGRLSQHWKKKSSGAIGR